MSCAFCARVADERIIVANDLAVAFDDDYPLSPGHCLVIPRRHEADYFALSIDEQGALWALAREAQRRLAGGEPRPDGYNLGINVGEVAGQTIDHAHLHVIPRYRGDVTDPRGGVRWVIPAKAAYWKKP